jgi:hypothetical protein
MTAPRIALVTCLHMPEPDPDRDVLLDALLARGADASWVAWDDPNVRWEDFDLAVPRSTWDYHRRLDEFLAWVDRAAKATQLLNPSAVLRWNAHKTYLRDLSEHGFHVIPTEWIARGTEITLLGVLARRGWTDAVLKPAVSAGSFETHRVDGRAPDQATFARLVADRDVMLQAYVPSVEGYGERSMIVIDGELTHAIRKSPRFAAGEEEVSPALAPAEDEREIAYAVLAHIGRDLLYARVDLARDDAGRPMLMEIELIEPSLFLLQSPTACDRFAAAILRRSRRTSG